MPLCYVGKATKIFMVVVAVVVVAGLVLGLAVFRHRNSDDRRQGHGRNPTFPEPIPAAATSSPGTMHPMPTPPPPSDVPFPPIDANTPPIPEQPPSSPPPPAQTRTPLPEAPPAQTTAPVPEPPPAVTPPSPPVDDGGMPLPPMASPSMEGVGTPGPIGR